MIRYSLTCPKSHAFEAWFPSSAAFDAQVKRKLVTCPNCGSAKVSKALMAPSVVTSEKKKAARTARKRLIEASRQVEAPADSGMSPQLAVDDRQRAMLKELKALRDKVLAASEYVGPRFAEEARRIHNKETPHRGIHGEARPEDVKALADDGIEVYPVPVLPDDQN